MKKKPIDKYKDNVSMKFYSSLFIKLNKIF